MLSKGRLRKSPRKLKRKDSIEKTISPASGTSESLSSATRDGTVPTAVDRASKAEYRIRYVADLRQAAGEEMHNKRNYAINSVGGAMPRKSIIVLGAR